MRKSCRYDYGEGSWMKERTYFEQSASLKLELRF